jgi:serine/threonine protein kinase/WD40 repeat protein
MRRLMTCPHGHQWESATDVAGLAGHSMSPCPVCGADSKPERSSVEDWPALRDQLPPACPPLPPPLSQILEPARMPVRWPALPGYEILCELGRGGMGVVYQARQQNLGRLVALKMLLADGGAGPEELARFRREAEAVAALRHANIVHIYDVGEKDGRPFFVLEYVDGGSLARRLARQPLPCAEAAELVATLARAMHRAHENGIVHRDLKPANILLMADGTPKIADFGLAKKLDATGEQTRTGAVLGTPNYMAPEQALGQTRDIGPATDVYALGTILYEALTGRPPFKGATLLDTLNDVVNRPPPPPRQLRPDVPADLEAICLRCLQKEPARRYASAADLAADLHRWRTGRPLQAGTLALSASRGIGRRRSLAAWIAVGAAALVLLAVAGVIWSLSQTSETQPDLLAKSGPPPSTAGPTGGSTPTGKTDPTGKIVGNGKNDPVEITPPDKPVKVEPVTISWSAGKLLCLAFAPNGQAVALGGEGDTVLLRDVKNGSKRGEFKGHPGHVYSLAFAPGGKTLAVGSYKQIWLWDVDGFKKLDILEGHLGKVTKVWFSFDGKTLATASEKQALVFGPMPGHEPAKFKGDNWALFPDGKTLASCWFALYASQLDLWDVTAGQEGVRIGLGVTVGSLMAAGSADGRTVAVAYGETVRVWEVATKDELASHHSKHTEPVFSLDLAPNGQIVASGSKDKSALLWGVTADKEFARLEGHTGPVLVRFSPDGKLLATASAADSFVKLWEVATGKERAELPGHKTGVVDLRFSPDGRTLAALGPDRVRLWTVSPLAWTKS